MSGFPTPGREDAGRPSVAAAAALGLVTVPVKTTTRLIGYVRVSTSEQGASGLGLEAQERAIREEAERRSWHVEHIYREVASGAKRAKRPQLEAAIEHVRTLDGAALVVAKIDRLARSSIRFHEIVQRSQAERWRLIIIGQLGLDTAGGRFSATVLQAAAEYEAELISERTRAALAAAKARGVRLGRAPLLPEAALRRVVELRLGGLSLRQVAARLNADGVAAPAGGRWDHAAVRRVLLRVRESGRPQDVVSS